MIVSRSKKPARAAVSAPARPDAARESGGWLSLVPVPDRARQNLDRPNYILADYVASGT